MSALQKTSAGESDRLDRKSLRKAWGYEGGQ